MGKSNETRKYHSPLREERAQDTQRRIVEAFAELVEGAELEEITTSTIAERAGVSQPTIFHYFPTKGALFQALAGKQYRQVAQGLDPRSPDELAHTFGLIYERSEAIEPLVRWTLANPVAAITPRPHRSDRMHLLRTALEDVLTGLSAEEATRLERIALLLSSPSASLFWKDYLGLSAAESADVAAWVLQTLVAHLQEPPIS